MPKTSRSRKLKPRAVKKSLSFTPRAWTAIERCAKINARESGTEPNYSEAASELVIAGSNHR